MCGYVWILFLYSGFRFWVTPLRVYLSDIKPIHFIDTLFSRVLRKTNIYLLVIVSFFIFPDYICIYMTLQ